MKPTTHLPKNGLPEIGQSANTHQTPGAMQQENTARPHTRRGTLNPGRSSIGAGDFFGSAGGGGGRADADDDDSWKAPADWERD